MVGEVRKVCLKAELRHCTSSSLIFTKRWRNRRQQNVHTPHTGKPFKCPVASILCLNSRNHIITAKYSHNFHLTACGSISVWKSLSVFGGVMIVKMRKRNETTCLHRGNSWQQFKFEMVFVRLANDLWWYGSVTENIWKICNL